MALLLFSIYQTGLRLGDDQDAREILVKVTIWHILASLWHFLAVLEHGAGLPSLSAFLPHYVIPCFYWIVFSLWNRVRSAESRASYEGSSVVAISLFCAAAYRLLQLHHSLQPLTHQIEDSVTSYLPSDWLWVVTVMYGGILTLALESLQNEIEASSSRANLVRLSFVAFGSLTFVFYVFSGYFVTVAKYPYQVSLWSMGRFLLDLSMSFFVMATVLPAIRRSSACSIREILLAVTAFHCCAVLWIVLASREYGNGFPSIDQFVPHLVAIASYWVGTFATFAALKVAGRTFDRSAGPYFVTQSALLLSFALYRAIQMLTAFRMDGLARQ